ncbi:hypothetical protein [Sulfitobacter sp. SK011]|uniref:hypothetical protein n=1 Tax=Sulfitobacter sp. SK011 TaxID=1389004 RepID=UPI000E09FF4B|nr:hypothetical protein [Sulfitobacter sp. SK011]AXI43615.1 hypothetical protein C1J02_18085 [Sulfitobacter sp. SK011]
MTKLTTHQKHAIKKFVSHPRGIGYVLDHSDTSFRDWFMQHWAVDIASERYADLGTSKGNRLVSFCLQAEPQKTLLVLDQVFNDANEIGIQDSEIVTQTDLNDFLIMVEALRTMAANTSEEKQPSLADKVVAGYVSEHIVRENSKRNATSIIMLARGTLEAIAEFRERIRKDNFLGAEKPEHRERLIALLDALSRNLEILLTILPLANEPDEKELRKLSSWTERYVNSALPKLQEYISPEALGHTTAPAGVILFCGAIGALITGLNPIGFGAGTIAGKLIIGEIKSGAAADKLQSRLSDTEH